MTRASLLPRLACLLAAVMLAPFAVAGDTGLDDGLLAIQKDWAVANYRTEGKKQRVKRFEALAERAADLSAQYPDQAEPLVWEGIVLSTFAGVKGGFGALKLARRAREKLDAAVAIDPTALDGSALTSLGTLYSKVPGRPLGFGSDEKALIYLKRGLTVNPDGIDSNYFYGEFLMEHGDTGEAIRYLERGLAAPPRPGRELADEGRRAEIRDLLDTARRG